MFIPSSRLKVSVGFFLELPVIRALHKRQLLFPVVVLVVVAGVLVQGAFDRNPPSVMTPESGESIPSPVVRPTIRGDLEKTPLTYFSDYWNQLAVGVRGSLILIEPTGTPGILIGPKLALTTIQPALAVVAARNRFALTRDEPEDVEDPDEVDEKGADIGERDGVTVDEVEQAIEEGTSHRLRAWDKEIGLALFDVDDEAETAFTMTDSRRLPSGSYIGAVTLDETGEPTVMPGSLVNTVAEPDLNSGNLILSINLPSTLSIAAIINLDGDMVGLAYSSEAGPRVVTTAKMLGLIEALQTEKVCRSVETSDLDEEVYRLFGIEEGVLIEYVHSESFAQGLSLQSGDVLLKWDDTSVESAEQFASVFDTQMPGSRVRYRVLRGRRRVTGSMVMPPRDCAPLLSEPVRFPLFGLAARWIDQSDRDRGWREGWYVVAVAPDGTAAAAGVQEFDYIRFVDGQGVESEDDRSILEAAGTSEQALVLSLLRDGRVKLIAVPPVADDVLAVVLAAGEIESKR
jgi:S1-C subfamily serine protease